MYYEIDETGNKLRSLPGYFQGFKDDLTGIKESLLSDMQRDYLVIPDENIIEVCSGEHELFQIKGALINELSARCKAERALILSDTTALNVLSGATNSYPGHLTPANVALMFEQYKKIYHTAEVQILAAESKEGIEIIMDELVFPTEEQILAQVEGV